MKNKTVAIEIGHGPTPTGFDSGTMSFANRISEYELNKVAALACQKRLAELNIPSSIIDEALSLGGLGKRAEGYACFVSIHHNSFNGKAQGVETLIENSTSNYKDRELANEIQKAVIFETKISTDRGVKEQGLAVLEGADSVGAVACLHECYFIDTPDWSSLQFKGVSADSGKLIANGIYNWYSKNFETNTPATPNTSTYAYVPATLPLDGSYVEIVRALQGLGSAPKKSLSSAEFNEAVKNFQTKNQLVVDGIAGPRTVKALGNALAVVRGTQSTPTTTTSQPVGIASLTRTSGKDVFGCYILHLKIGDKTFEVCSGQPNAQFFRLPADPKSYPGCGEPIPQGRYAIGDLDWADGKDNYDASHGAGLGPVKAALIAEFKDDRNLFYLHIDSNRNQGAPGTMGCVAPYGVSSMKEVVAALREFDPKDLIVDWNL